MPGEERVGGITAVILAGGLNARYPGPKGLIKIDGRSIMERNAALLRSVFDEVLISSNRPDIYGRFGSRVVVDALPSRGPMTGVYTALLNAGDDDVFVTACDIPFPSAGLIRLLCRRHMRLEAGDRRAATIPLFRGRPQPLFGIYGRVAIASMKEAILSDKVCLARFLDEIGAAYLPEADVRTVDPDGRSFININTPEDLEGISGIGPEGAAGHDGGCRE
jgi:molybdopterin-guanine dinucleotide biosynthesis protein A